MVLHRKRIQEVSLTHRFWVRNTELAYNDDLAKWADHTGYHAVLAEGWDKVLDWRSPNYVYKPTGTENIKLLTKNFKLSDDIAFPLATKHGTEWPLSTGKYVIGWESADGQLSKTFMDFQDFWRTSMG